MRNETASRRLLARFDGDVQTIARRSERTAPPRIERARRRVGEVQIDDEIAAEIGSLDGVEDVPAAAICRLPARSRRAAA